MPSPSFSLYPAGIGSVELLSGRGVRWSEVDDLLEAQDDGNERQIANAARRALEAGTMRTLELFAGTASFSKVARARGHKTFTVDIDPQHNPDLCMDVLEMSVDDLPAAFRHPDVVWASIPCTCFSIATADKNWDKIGGVYFPKTPEAEEAVRIAKKALALIKELAPRHFIIENPRGFLRCMPWMRGIGHRRTVYQCSYGGKNCKPTDLWLTAPFNPRIHRKGHWVRESWTGGNPIARAVIPPALCEEIVKACEASP